MSRRWLTEPVVLAIHDEQLAEHGGRPGVRSRELLGSALQRPIHKEAYSDPSAGKLAAAYAFGLSKDHPFHDGNKRTALVVAETFLELNGYELNADDQDCYRIIMGVAAGELNEGQLFEWFDSHTVKMLV
jgi:death-on-curing protein